MEHAAVVAERQLRGSGAFQEHVKVKSFKGASLGDPKRLFKAGLEAKPTRAIDIREADTLDEMAFKNLVREAVQADGTGKAKRAK